MQLMIDLGNSALKWALCDQNGTMSELQRALHYGALPVDVLAAWSELSAIEQVYVAAVGSPAVVAAIAQVSQACWGCSPQIIDSAMVAKQIPLRLAYADPAQLGLDRQLALWAAQALAVPVLIVDAGTAITYDLLTADGKHLGGVILPGLKLMRESLLQGTRIPPHEADTLAHPWGTNTGTAINAATLHAPAALAERLLHTSQQQLGARPRLIVTGGDAEQLQPWMPPPVELQPDLVLRGLALAVECFKPLASGHRHR